MASIHTALAAIFAETEAITKDKKNQQQGFQYRGIDDVYNALHPIFAKHKVFILPRYTGRSAIERQTRQGGALFSVTVEGNFRFVHEDGSEVECTTIGEAMDSGDKATNKAMSIALKYALFQVLLIPTTDDPDAEVHEVAPKQAAAPASRPAAPTRNEKMRATAAQLNGWRAAVIHFGKLNGKALGSLPENSLSWWVEKWNPYEGKYEAREADIALRKALDEAAVELGMQSPCAAVTDGGGDSPDDDVPF